MGHREDEGRDTSSVLRHGWSQSGNLTTGGNDLVSLSATFPDHDTYVVQFSLQGNTPTIENEKAGVNATAEILWSVADSTTRRTVTIGNGVTVQGSARGVKINVKDESVGVDTNGAATVAVVQGSPNITFSSPQLPVPAGTLVALPGGNYALKNSIPSGGTTGVLTTPYLGPTTAAVNGVGLFRFKYAVTISVTRGVRPTTEQPPQLFDQTITLSNKGIAGDTLLVDIPNDAGVISMLIELLNLVVLTQTVSVTFFNGATLVGAFLVPNDDLPSYVPIPPDATIAFIQNQDPADTVQVTVWFGIDG